MSWPPEQAWSGSALPLGPSLLTNEQKDLAGEFGAAMLAEILLQMRKENRGFQFSAYQLPNSCIKIADKGQRLGVFTATQWAKVWGSTALTRPWCELAIKRLAIFNSSEEAEAIRTKLFPKTAHLAH